MDEDTPCPQCPEGECACNVVLICGMESDGTYVINTPCHEVVLCSRHAMYGRDLNSRDIIFALRCATCNDQSSAENNVYVTAHCDSTVLESCETASSRHVIHFTCTFPSAGFYMEKIDDVAAFAFSPDPDACWQDIFHKEDAEWAEGTRVTTVGIGRGSGIRGSIAGKVDHLVGQVHVDLHGARGKTVPVYIYLEHLLKDDICEFDFQFKRDGAEIRWTATVDYTSFAILNITDKDLIKKLVRAAHIGMHVESVTALVKLWFALHVPHVYNECTMNADFATRAGRATYSYFVRTARRLGSGTCVCGMVRVSHLF